MNSFSKIFKFGRNNEIIRKLWLEKTLLIIPKGKRILDAGAGELANKKYCTHLEYVSQDFCQYEGKGNAIGLQTEKWNTSKIDLVSDICTIPEADAAFDAVLCSEVFEHIPNPVRALEEFSRLIKNNGILIITAPFCSLSHFSPYHYTSGLNRYWYEYHLPKLGFELIEITSNGDWFDFVAQEIQRLPAISKTYSYSVIFGWTALFFAIPFLFLLFLQKILQKKCSDELLCFGFHVVARRHKK